jgi:hypothetical protein
MIQFHCNMSWKEHNVTLVTFILYSSIQSIPLFCYETRKKKISKNIFHNSKALPQVICRMQFLDVSKTVQRNL